MSVKMCNATGGGPCPSPAACRQFDRCMIGPIPTAVAPPDPGQNPKDLAGAAKPQLHLIPPAASLFEAKVMALGAAKYGAYNWRKNNVLLTVYISAAQRHLLQLLDGETTDSESGQPHAAHVRSCMGIILDAMANGNLIDDRPPPGPASQIIKDMSA